MSTPPQRPTLSVVVPFYNVEAYLGACLESLRVQLLEDIDVVMVDDGSTDGSRAVAERFAAADPRFRLIRQENRGLGPARNTGAAATEGTYLTFVDSDDVVPPRGYRLMVDTLDETGSDFAAGNAFRFSATKGVYQSWTHRIPFAETHLRTTIEAHPELIRDRMVWNKVYRRSFWDSGRFEFPAIRYEDYMVTLRAYLEASSVDVLANHVYFWRDRESGDSITQQAARADNAVDRYLSAGMVLDVLRDHSVSEEVRERVHAYFIHIDVLALAESMVAVAPEHRAEAERMALDLASRLTTTNHHGATRLARLVHAKLLEGDLATVRALASWRTSGNHRALASFLSRHPDPAVVWVAARALLASRRPQNPLKPRRLRTQLTEASWIGSNLHLTVTARLRAQLAHGAAVTAHLIDPSGEVAPVPVTVMATPARGGLDLALTVSVEAVPHWPTAGVLVVDVRRRGVRWRGRVNFETEVLPEIHETARGWLQVRGFGADLGLQRVDDPVVASVSAEAGTFRLSVRSPSFETTPSLMSTTLTVHRPHPSETVVIALDAGEAEVPARVLVDGDPADDVVTGIAERPVTGPDRDRTNRDGWTAESLEGSTDELAVPQEGFATRTPSYVYLRGPGARVELADRIVSLSRGRGGMLVVRQERATPDTPITPSVES